MKRIAMQPRPDWRAKCEAAGLSFHSLPSENGAPYWRESAAYRLSIGEVEQVEAWTSELFARCMDAVEYVVKQKRYEEFGIPEAFWPLIGQSWERDDATVFGRFDLSWQPDGTAKLLEFNADTPTSLVESSVAQWFWLKDVFGSEADQFNSLHERLVEQWRHIATNRWRVSAGTTVHVSSLHDTGDGQLLVEDFDNVAYMAETMQAAGLRPKHVFIEDITWSALTNSFVDSDGQPIQRLYKLYPWEWLVNETYAPHIIASWSRMDWVEPIWKMLLSNKQLLVVLWELFPDHPLLLPASNDPAKLAGMPVVAKPPLGREGANVRIMDAAGKTLAQTPGAYGTMSAVWQAYSPLPQFDGWHAVVGSWIVGETPCGVGFRESSGLITTDSSFFVPHYIAGS